MTIKDKMIQGIYFAVAPVTEIYSKQYKGIMENGVHSYANNVALPFGLFFLNKYVVSSVDELIGSSLRKHKWMNAGLVFLGCAGFETAQGLGRYPGTYDTTDLLAYAVGTGVALTVDKYTFDKKHLENLVSEPINEPKNMNPNK